MLQSHGSLSALTPTGRAEMRANLRRLFAPTRESGGIRIETFYALYATALGGTLLLPFDSFATAAIYDGLRVWPEWLWGVLFLLSSTANVAGFLTGRSRVRFVGSCLLTFCMTFWWWGYVSHPAAWESLVPLPLTVLLGGQFSVTATMRRTSFRGRSWTPT